MINETPINKLCKPKVKKDNKGHIFQAAKTEN